MFASIQEDVLPVTLESHAALASRLIRSKPVLQIYFRWLTRPTAKAEPPQPPLPAIKTSLDQLLNPLRLEADRTTQRETETSSLWLGSICQYVAQRSHFAGGSYLIRTLAASLLPLYRTLATGRLQEGLAQTRHRLGETLVLIGIGEILQLETFFDSQTGPQMSPHRALSEQLKIDVSNLDFLFSQVFDGYNQAKDEFNAKADGILRDFRPSDKLPTSHQIPDWASPQLLWVLSNELVSNRSELVLPRSWIDTPVPWSKISEHWSQLESLLTQSSAQTEAAKNTSSAGSKSDSLGPQKSSNLEPVKSASQLMDQPELAAVSALDQAAAIVEAAESGWENFESMDVIDRVLEEEFHNKKPRIKEAKPESAQTKETMAVNRPVAKREPAIVPKVLIGEITNHNDPAFANVVRRQVGICKQEDRSICLSMIMVTAQDQRENQSLSALHDNGLSRWQQKLVNWICDHPELKQPLAFLTRDGQLILVVMDSERNAMTRILRQGLVEVLTGKKDQSGDLSRVAIPANFHVGMSSTSSPGASFEFEELIASAHRCQSAAQRMGSASIKSIEVY